jgi:hypothetical protein
MEQYDILMLLLHIKYVIFKELITSTLFMVKDIDTELRLSNPFSCMIFTSADFDNV